MNVKDPVCGMEIDPQSAFASREHMGQTLHFCSQSCVDQFDADSHKHAHSAASRGPLAGSATTGVNPALAFSRIELPVIGLDKNGGRKVIETALRAIPGVRAANANAGMVVVEYDPQSVTVDRLSAAVKSAGYRLGGAQTRIGIANLRCASCVGFIEDELRSTSGVLDASVNVATQEATVNYLPEKTHMSQFEAAIQAWGYRTRPAVSDKPVDKQQEAHEKEYRRLMGKFWFAALISLPVLLTAYPQYVPFVRDWSMATLRLVWSLAAIITLPVLLWSGSDFFTGMWAALKHRAANMNTLIATGTAAAWLYSTVAVLFPAIFPEGTSEPFYDVVSVVIALVVLGQALELRAKGRTSEAIKKL
ncbi:MAG: cation transporter, partial [Chloroflexota bacterium]